MDNAHKTHGQSLEDLFGEPIHVYTRAQALEDGVLVDLTEWARETGFTVPVACTARVWSECIEWPATERPIQDTRGRAHDVLWMLFLECRRAKASGSTVGGKTGFRLRVVPLGRTFARLVTLACFSGPGDNGEHVLTIMFPEED